MGIVRCLVAGAPSQWSAAKRDRTLNSALELTLGVTPDDAKARSSLSPAPEERIIQISDAGCYGLDNYIATK